MVEPFPIIQLQNTAAMLADISQIGKQVEAAVKPSFRKATGAYFTAGDLAKKIIDDVFSAFSQQDKADLPNKTFLEPCVGMGSFVFAYLEKVAELCYPAEAVRQIINNIYVCDSNPDFLNLYRQLFTQYVAARFGFALDDAYFAAHMGGGLLFDVTNFAGYVPLSDVFPQISGFDIIVTNPPYKNLKAEKGHYAAAGDHRAARETYAQIATAAKTILPHASTGVLNLYKLFTEEIVTRYAAENAHVGLLIPASILTDKTCEKLRDCLLHQSRVFSIRTIQENNAYLSANQALCAMLLQTHQTTTTISILSDTAPPGAPSVEMDLADIVTETSNAIVSLSATEYPVFSRLRSFPTVGSLGCIVNLRGELDLTANKAAITPAPTPYKLLRGRHIALYQLAAPTGEEEYVHPGFVHKSAKGRFANADRIVCQQVVNMQKEKRVTFAYVEQGYVLGNSCNFIAVTENEYGIDLYYLLGLFNSSLINWYFKRISSNNHVNNYEMDSFPVPLDTHYIRRISASVQAYLHARNKPDKRNSDILLQIDRLVSEAFGLSFYSGDSPAGCSEPGAVLYRDRHSYFPGFSQPAADELLDANAAVQAICAPCEPPPDDFQKKIFQSISEKHSRLRAGQLLNHTTFKLSDLDMEMVRAVPQGGNWQDIPHHVTQKSKRLLRINETGGRTTLYGRIHPDKPSYTITTYFNRPGNGSYIHPTHDRVLSVREAARLQSFPDTYYFVGNKSDLLKQVGNAVPPLLAYQIGKQIKKVTGCSTSIDLFCGAGGMTTGFKQAGFTTKLGTDFDKNACITFAANNPEIPVLCGDITEQSTKDFVVQTARRHRVEMICGGPPCQGFSLAGKRFIDDPRNQLFRHFVEVVRRASPEIVVMENVEGILTFQKGAIYAQILSLFTEMGYNTEGRVLLASEYGVPQKRKRVILICVKNKMRLRAAELFPPQTTAAPELQIAARDALCDIETVLCDDTAPYPAAAPLSGYLQELRGLAPFGAQVDKAMAGASQPGDAAEETQ